MASGKKKKHHPLEGLSVQVEDVVYMPSLDAPKEQPHPFVYFITIINDSIEQVHINGRKWIVRQSSGETTVVEGAGVVGQKPVLEPGEQFSYNSYHITASDALVSGAFFATTATGDQVMATIPEFKLELPDWA